MEKRPGVWECSVTIGAGEEERFQIMRDHDSGQKIYPAFPDAESTDIPVCGVDNLEFGRSWRIYGRRGETVNLRLEVADGSICVRLRSESMGDRCWKNRQGWDQHTYCVSGTWTNGEAVPMVMDRRTPGVFRSRGTTSRYNFSTQFHGFAETFRIVLDGYHNCRLHPEINYSLKEESMTLGPDSVGEQQWLILAFYPDHPFEIVLDLN